MELTAEEKLEMRRELSAAPKKPPTLPLGALDTATGHTLFPPAAEKRGVYACPCCQHAVILCRGEIRISYFRHKSSEDAKTCRYFSYPSESAIHKNAKEQMRQFLGDVLHKQTPLTIFRECQDCNVQEDVQVITVTGDIHLEKVIRFRGSTKKCDVACMIGDQLRYIFEIYNTHRIAEGERPEPWFELQADHILKEAGEHAKSGDPLRLQCNRTYYCRDCWRKKIAGLRWNNLEQYVRTLLDQSFPAPIIDDQGRIRHARLNFNAHKNVEGNREIIERFKEDFDGLHVVVHSKNGTLYGYIILEDEVKDRDYWDYSQVRNLADSSGMTRYVVDLNGTTTSGTVSVIMELIRRSKEFRDEARKEAAAKEYEAQLKANENYKMGDIVRRRKEERDAELYRPPISYMELYRSPISYIRESK
jgi:hypothetical protein